MYATIVESKVRSLFREVNRGNWQAVVDGFAPKFLYRFLGDNALSGERTTKASMTEWWKRSFRLLPNAQFEVRDILVQGTPWNTRIMTWMVVRSTLANGQQYENEFMQHMGLSWGKVTSVLTIEDTQHLGRALDSLAAAGVEEARAAPISDARSSRCVA